MYDIGQMIIRKSKHILVITRKGDEIEFSLEDEGFAKAHNFYVNAKGYVCTNVKINNKVTCIHANRLLLNAQPGQRVRVKNKNKSDLRRENLELKSKRRV